MRTAREPSKLQCEVEECARLKSCFAHDAMKNSLRESGFCIDYEPNDVAEFVPIEKNANAEG